MMSPCGDGSESSGASIECDLVVAADDVPLCHRCAGPSLLVARIPHRIDTAAGGHVAGTRGIALCSTCDRDDPDGQGVLAFFAVYESIGDDVLESAAALILEWVEKVLCRIPVDLAELEQESDDDYKSWLNGDF